MEENQSLGIPYVKILPKPEARIMMIGRDPSPRTAKIVGIPDGKSVFIKEIFSLAKDSGTRDENIYITDVCKCHWRTSRGIPLKGTKERERKLDKGLAKICINNWLVEEIKILCPKLIVSFGEEVYSLLMQYIVEPNPAPKNLSLTKDKSRVDAELFFIEGGSFNIKFGNIISAFAPLRHPGNTTSLQRSDPTDKRWNVYQMSRQKVVKLMQGI